MIKFHLSQENVAVTMRNEHTFSFQISNNAIKFSALDLFDLEPGLLLNVSINSKNDH